MFVHGHVRIQSVVLEHHCDVAIFRGNVIDKDGRRCTVHLSRFPRGLRSCAGWWIYTAAGRADENDELFVFDFKAEIGNSGDITRIDFVDVFKLILAMGINLRLF